MYVCTVTRRASCGFSTFDQKWHEWGWSWHSLQNDIPHTRKARMNKPFGKAREGSYIFQFDTSLWSHNVELFGRSLHVIFLSYFTPVLSQICTVRYPTILEQTRSTPGQRLKHNTVQNNIQPWKSLESECIIQINRCLDILYALLIRYMRLVFPLTKNRIVFHITHATLVYITHIDVIRIMLVL